ncbi:Protein AAR2 homolog (AAR2 splicing factor homolog) [Durusdinium trenchii]|uniref:Protein AAR2 homolog (AAR2 splicing factor homolog) n=1 Tax=Durusdinium trenchii TaxID=1381693 RepID=A0ABP0L812_9DINO
MAEWRGVPNEALKQAMGHGGQAGTIACLDAPRGLELGVDLKSFTIGDRFKGIKLLPPGLHFLHYQQAQDVSRGVFVQLGTAAGSSTAGAEAVGELDAAPRVAGFRWDPREEDFGALGDEDLARLTQAVLNLELDSHLGPFDTEHWGTWTALTRCVDLEVLQRVGVPLNSVIIDAPQGKVSTSPMLQHNSQVSYCAPTFTTLPNLVDLSRRTRQNPGGSERDSLAERMQQLPGMHFLVDDQGHRLSPAKVTELQMDPSNLVLKLIKVDYAGHQELFVGELQLAFVIFLYLASLPALEFWKQAVHLVASCSALRASHPELMRLVVQTVTSQFFLLPKDLFQDDLLQDNFLVEALATLVDLADLGPDSVLLGPLRDLRKVLRDRYGKGLLARLDSFNEETENAFTFSSIDKREAEIDNSVHFQEVTGALAEDDDEENHEPEQGQRGRESSSPARMAWMLGP